MVADWSRTFARDFAGLAPDWQADHPKQAADLGVQADALGLAVVRAWAAMFAGAIEGIMPVRQPKPCESQGPCERPRPCESQKSGAIDGLSLGANPL